MGKTVMPAFMTRRTIGRLLFLLLWLVLFGTLLQRELFVKQIDLREAQVIKQAQETDFLSIYFHNQRIGYVKNHLAANPETSGFTLAQDAILHLNILGEIHPIRLQVTAGLTDTLLLQDFSFQLSSPLYSMNARGTVTGQRVDFTIHTGKDTIKDSVELARPPFLPINRRSYLLTQNLKQGDKVTIPYFDPISLTGKDTLIEYHGIDKVLVRGRIHTLHRFSESFAGLRISSWLDDTGKVVKEESPAGFVFIAEPEFKATDIVTTGSRELLQSVAVPLTGTMPELGGRTRIGYRLTLPEEAEFVLSRDRQQLTDNLLTVSLETLEEHHGAACPDQPAALASTPYIQSKNKMIVETAQDITKATGTDFDKVLQLADWVFGNLEKRPVLGIPDALTTLHTRRGDCNEHAALFAALARSTGIPTRVVAGVTYHEGFFYYHAWNEVCLGEKWLSLDTTKNQLPADLSHIKFVQGEIKDMVQIGGLINNLEIGVDPGEEAGR
jgi:hypothetical protein